MSALDRFFSYVGKRISQQTSGALDSRVPQSSANWLTDRGMRIFQQWCADVSRRATHDQAVMTMVKSQGWQIIEGELAAEVTDLYVRALRQMASPLQSEREEAIVSYIIANAINAGVLGRVNRRLLDTAIAQRALETMTKLKAEFNHVTGSQE